MNFFNGTEAQLYTGSSNFSTKITAAPLPLGLSVAQATAYAAANALWSAAYLAGTNPDTKTKGKVAEKNSQKVAIKKMASDYANIIRATPGVTDEQLIDLGLNVRAHPSRNPRPDVRPGTDLIGVSLRDVDVHIHDSASSTKRGKPAGCHCAWVYSFIGSDYPSDPAAWDFQGACNGGKFTVSFDNTVPAGAQIWICAAWVNFRSEAGPISVPITTNLQGGGSTAEAA